MIFSVKDTGDHIEKKWRKQSWTDWRKATSWDWRRGDCKRDFVIVFLCYAFKSKKDWRFRTTEGHRWNWWVKVTERSLPSVMSSIMNKLATFSFLLKKQLELFYIYKLQNPQPAIMIFKDHLSKSCAVPLLPPRLLMSLEHSISRASHSITHPWLLARVLASESKFSPPLTTSSCPALTRRHTEIMFRRAAKSSWHLINGAHNEWVFGN